MSNRYAESVDKIADYLYWLLPNFFKKKVKHDSLVYRLLKIFGKQLENVRDDINLLNRQFTAATAFNSHLDEIGKARGVFRLKDEQDDDFKNRILVAHLEKQKAGTIPGMTDGLKILGFEVDLIELFQTDRSRWSEFIIRINTWDGAVNQTAFYNEINHLKPAHTRMIVDPMLNLDEFDNGFFDDVDNSHLDSWEI